MKASGQCGSATKGGEWGWHSVRRLMPLAGVDYGNRKQSLSSVAAGQESNKIMLPEGTFQANITAADVESYDLAMGLEWDRHPSAHGRSQDHTE